jgi:hypothetical protein
MCLKLMSLQLEPYMTEKFLINAFNLMGDEDIKSIKVIIVFFTLTKYFQIERQVIS